MRICRYTNPAFRGPCASESELLCLMRRQNELLTEILAALLTRRDEV